MLFYPFCIFICYFISCIDGKVFRTKVAILGAGASGVSAAKTLSNENMHDFLLVDAQSFIGGNKAKFP